MPSPPPGRCWTCCCSLISSGACSNTGLTSGNRGWTGPRFCSGCAMANNWGMVAFLPLFLVALLRTKRFGFFSLRTIQRIERSGWESVKPALNTDLRFFLRMALLGLAGLSLVLVLPLLQVFSPDSTLGFWQALRAVAASYWEAAPFSRSRVPALPPRPRAAAGRRLPAAGLPAEHPLGRVWRRGKPRQVRPGRFHLARRPCLPVGDLRLDRLRSADSARVRSLVRSVCLCPFCRSITSPP